MPVAPLTPPRPPAPFSCFPIFFQIKPPFWKSSGNTARKALLRPFFLAYFQFEPPFWKSPGKTKQKKKHPHRSAISARKTGVTSKTPRRLSCLLLQMGQLPSFFHTLLPAKMKSPRHVITDPITKRGMAPLVGALCSIRYSDRLEES